MAYSNWALSGMIRSKGHIFSGSFMLLTSSLVFSFIFANCFFFYVGLRSGLTWHIYVIFLTNISLEPGYKMIHTLHIWCIQNTDNIIVYKSCASCIFWPYCIQQNLYASYMSWLKLSVEIARHMIPSILPLKNFLF